MLVRSFLRFLLLTPAVLAAPLFSAGLADSLSSAAATTAAVGGATALSASATATASSAVSGVSTLPLFPRAYGPLQTIPVAQTIGAVRHLPVVPNYQALQPQITVYDHGGAYGNGYGLGVGGIGLAGGGFGRYRESYTYKARGFGGGLIGFGRHGFRGGRIKAHYSSRGLTAGGFAGIGGRFIDGAGAALWG